jgi:hypothetical protein
VLEAEAAEEEALDALAHDDPEQRWKNCSTPWPPTRPTTMRGLTM